MKSISLLTDGEPIDSLSNPLLTLEEAESDLSCEYAVSVMKDLGRNVITRLQYIEVLMIEDNIRIWTEDREYGDNHIPRRLMAKGDNWFVPAYLKGSLTFNYKEVNDQRCKDRS